MAKEENPDFKYIVRLANTDLDGKYQVEPALAVIKGVGIRLAALAAENAGVSRYKKIGDCTDEEIEKMGAALERLPEIAPVWMLNRARDLETGEDTHLVGADLETKKRDDLNRLKKIRSYRGVRHDTNQKVRGQRSRSNGRTGLTVGVIKKKEGAPAPAKDDKK